MAEKNKNWLILSHCFNMDGRAASQTITDKIPFLIEKGITPIVLSAPTGRQDKKFIHHQVLSPSPSGINFELRKIIEKKYHKGIKSEILKGIVTVLLLPFLLIEKILINLDSHWSWFISAGIKGVFLIKKYSPGLIYSTAGPSSTHLAGYLLHKLFHIPWIAEIHDPLITDTGKRRYQRYAFHKWLEKAIFQNAHAVIYFTENALNNARQRTQVFNNSHVLRPGANPPELKGVRYKKREKIHFGHFGSLASDRNLGLLLRGLHSVLKKEPRLIGKVVLDIYGTALDSDSKKVVKNFAMEDVVCEHGRLEFDPITKKSGRLKVFEMMHECDVLVLLHGETDICDEYIPSKVYEYLLTQRPIAGIASAGSELGQLLRSAGHRIIENNIKDIEDALQTIIHDWENGQLKPGGSSCVFTAENAANKLVGLSEL